MKKSNRLWLLALTLIAVLVLAACGDDGDAVDEPDDETDPDTELEDEPDEEDPEDDPADDPEEGDDEDDPADDPDADDEDADDTAADGEFVTDLTFGTGGTAGVYYPLGNEYARLFEEHIEEVPSVNAIESDGSVDNLAQIFGGSMQIGLSQNNTAIEATEGIGQFEGEGALDNVGWLGQLYPEVAQVITLEESGFESVADLEGARIAVGAPGSGTRAVAEAILDAYGIGEGDYEMYDESFADARSLMQDGNLDASIEILGAPAASLQELAATNDVRLLPLDDEIATQIEDETDFVQYTVEADVYDFLDEDVPTVSVFAGAVASMDQVSPELGYELTRVLYEHAEDISLEQGNLIDIDDALLGSGDLPLHPGAEEYFEEQGIERQ